MSREQRLEAALRNAHAFIWNVVPVPGSLLSDKKRATLQAIAAVLGEQEAAEVLALSDDDLERRWTEGTPATVTLSTWHAGEQEATPPEPDEDYRAWQRAAEAPTVYSQPLPEGDTERPERCPTCGSSDPNLARCLDCKTGFDPRHGVTGDLPHRWCPDPWHRTTDTEGER